MKLILKNVHTHEDNEVNDKITDIKFVSRSPNEKSGMKNENNKCKNKNKFYGQVHASGRSD